MENYWGTAHILIAEHNRMTSRHLAAALRKAGNTVTIVDNCTDAQKAISKEYFDILLLDLFMPEMDSARLTQEALQYNPELKLMLLNGFSGIARDARTAASPVSLPLVASRPFHLTEVAGYARYLMGQGRPFSTTSYAEDDDNVVYADFNAGKIPAQQQSIGG